MAPKTPIINCHTHIFTGDHVPPYLAKKFLPWPFYLLVPLSLFVKAFRYYYKTIDKWNYKPELKKLETILYKINISIKRTVIGRILSFFIGLFLSIQVFYIVYDWIKSTGITQNTLGEKLSDFREFLAGYHLIHIPIVFILKLLLVFILLIFFKTGRNLIFFILKKIWSFLGVLPGKQSKELIERYLSIGRFAFHTTQRSSFEDLRDQYPANTGFVVLPMDMEYMDAGDLGKGYSYLNQMEELKALKTKDSFTEILFPFVFADPRRIQEQPDYFSYDNIENKVVLKECFIKEYIEEHHFKGFKIYPALGYYPFDENLLPLWKYASDNNLPIMTHCIRGTIFYRGSKKNEWDTHLIFKQNCGKDTYEPLLLKELDNVDFCNNFTHPLNYLCLLEEPLLREVVKKAKDQNIRDLFGYTNESTPLKHNLNNLKICFAHFGGDDEWKKFLEMDRYDFTKQIITHPYRGIKFFPEPNERPTPGKIEQLWKNVDWYSIICSIMLQYKNVYADVSYIIHNNSIHPLLKQTLSNEKLNKKVLFGTDFYVVRNHKSEKCMLAESYDNLSEEEMIQIAYSNAKTYLNNTLHGSINL